MTIKSHVIISKIYLFISKICGSFGELKEFLIKSKGWQKIYELSQREKDRTVRKTRIRKNVKGVYE